MIDVGSTYGPRVEVETSEVRGPCQMRHVCGAELVGIASRGKRDLHSFDPIGRRLRDSLLKERLALGAVGKTLQHGRPLTHSKQRTVTDSDVVIHQVEL